MSTQERAGAERAQLSEAGESRRRAMLARLEREVVWRGRRRRVARAAVAGVPVLLLAVGVLVVRAGLGGPGRPARGGAEPERRAPVDVARAPDAGPDIDVEPSRAEGPRLDVDLAAWDVVPRVRGGGVTTIVHARTDGGLVRRVRASGAGGIGQASDERLAGGLRAAGIAAGVVRTPEGVRIVADRAEASGVDG